ncbi:helix-turn-helix domain-containing protein [Microbacterium sp.]|uniref:helix-turn-helix domain-containing protein n=1 Tax=Microbacterium sp. TaxID=51671 RepID=UPI0032426296
MIVPEVVREMPAAHPPEFRRRALDLVAQGNPDGQTASDLGISESCLRNWMNRDAINAGRKHGLTTDEHKELVESRRPREQSRTRI